MSVTASPALIHKPSNHVLETGQAHKKKNLFRKIVCAFHKKRSNKTPNTIHKVDVVYLTTAKATKPKKVKYYNDAALERKCLRASIELEPLFKKFPSRVRNLLSLPKNQFLAAAKSGHLDTWAADLGFVDQLGNENQWNEFLGDMWRDARCFHLIMTMDIDRFKQLPDFTLAEIGLADFDCKKLEDLWIDKKKKYFFSLDINQFARIKDEEWELVKLGPTTTSRAELWKMFDEPKKQKAKKQ
ncbi:hypothetical protein [Labrenzia sp. THAF82]|uniref:hypothetical protein n=1 Tax=Labrenzia sp. THAF82 TaxID=2587861 RepID=UPI001268B86C|nr:hypothetical protein [Labrenzia sp. THAF82]